MRDIVLIAVEGRCAQKRPALFGLLQAVLCEAKLMRLKDQAGQPTKVQGAAAQGAFQLASIDLASSKGSRWADPDLRQWNGDSGTLHQFNWNA